mgnify:CR=1 FL=1
MDLNFSMRPETRALLGRVAAMIRNDIMPLEEDYQAEIARGTSAGRADNRCGATSTANGRARP